MYVLGIETSCDETAAAVVRDGRYVLSNIVASSLNFHKKYGGIVPEIASRMQLKTIAGVVDSALTEAGVSLKDLGLVSVTSGPGLLGSLVVGISFAKSISLSLGIPILGINHLHSHIYSNYLNGAVPDLPFIALVVSGGHTSLYSVKDFDKIRLIGSTYDDACGEAFDKVAKILGLGYPGGPIIEKLAKKGNPGKIKFRCSDTDEPFAFSFSGIKTGVLYYVKKQPSIVSHKSSDKKTHRPLTIDHRLQCDIAASFEEAVIDVLIKKSFLACGVKRIKRLVVGGGVAANNLLRERFFQKAKKENISVYFPKKEFCMDNAAMVAGLGYKLFRKGKTSSLYLNADLE